MEKKQLLALALAQKHGAGEPVWARPWRWAKTVFFLVSMLASLLLVCAPPLLVILLDLGLPPALLSAHLPPYRSFVPAVLDQARAFDFRSSLVDLPAVCAARALLILCAYTACGGGGAYLWVVVASVAASVSYVLAKAAAAAVLPCRVALQGKGEAAGAGPEPMLLLSLSLAAAHLAVAYRTSCRERRRLLVYRIDVEAVRLKGGHQTPKGLKQMTVAPLRSGDARPHGGRRAPAPAGGEPAQASPCLSPTHLPPPPASLPPNFTPAFLGFVAARGSAPDGSGSGAKTLRPDSSAPSAPVLVGRRLQSVVVGSLLLPTPPPEVCAGVNAALTTWRSAGCPPPAPPLDRAPRGILRAPVIHASAPPRPRRSVRFCVPAPRIHGDDAPPSPPRFQAGPQRSRPLPRAPEQDSRSTSMDGPWIRVLSRRERCDARRAAPEDGPGRRSRHATPPQRPRRPPNLASTERVSAFRRKLRGLCFRCFSPRHFAKHCRDPIRCLTCRRSGHRAKDCVDHLAISIARDASLPRAPPPARRRPDGSSSWAQVVAPQGPPPVLDRRPARWDECCVRVREDITPSPACQPGSSSTWTLVVAPQGSPPVLDRCHVRGDECHEFDFRVHEDFATPRLLKEGVDGALADENERVGLLLSEQGEDKLCEEVEHELQPSEVTGEVRPSQGPFNERRTEEPVQEMMARFEASHAAALKTDADAGAATLGNLLVVDADEDTDIDDDADDGGSAPSSGAVIRSVADLFSLSAVPLLPTPLPSTPRAPVALPTPERRSSRLAEKPILPAVEKAQRVLHKKMGLDVGEMPLVQATKEFADTCKRAPFSDSAINGLRTLFRLNLPSMTEADEALIGLAGPGGSDFPPPTALDVFV